MYKLILSLNTHQYISSVKRGIFLPISIIVLMNI